MLIVNIIFFILSLVIVLLSADLLVQTAVKLSHKLRISPFIVGLTAVAIGTSLPEIVISTFASIQNQAGLSLGNIIGSNIVNVTLGLGIPFLFFSIRIGAQKTQAQNLILFLITLSFASWLLILNKTTALFGIVCLLVSVLTILYQVKSEHDEIEKQEVIKRTAPRIITDNIIHLLSKMLFSLVVILLGSKLLIQESISILTALSIGGQVFGLTIVAIGTSIPEITTSLVAAYKNETKLLLGDILGSNIFNLLIGGGLSAIFSTLSIENKLILPLWLLISASLFLMIKRFSGRHVPRIFGLWLIVVFAIYIRLVVS